MPVTSLFRARIALAMLALLLLMPWGRAWSHCPYNGSGVDVRFSVPDTIVVPYDAQVGDVLYETPQVPPAEPLRLSCSGNTDYGISNSVGSTPNTRTAIYPTGVDGIGYRLLHGDNSPSNYMYPFPCCRLSSGTYDFSVSTALQFVKTGPIANGRSLSSGRLARWLYERTASGNTASVQNYVLANRVTFVQAACRLNTANIAVTLPTVPSLSLPSVDATTGSTPFRINLTCSAGSRLNIMFDTDAAVPGKTGVIASTTGNGRATGVGVQIVDSGAVPVDFKREYLVGATPQGALELTYNARYYRTGTAMQPGTISATATFTLSYD